MRETLVEIKGIDFGYGTQKIFVDFSLQLAASDFLILTGPNGGGKTTLLRLIGGLLSPSRGYVKHKDGLTIGYLPQIRKIDRNFPITAEEVVLSGLQNRKPLWKKMGSAERELVRSVMSDLDVEDVAQR